MVTHTGNSEPEYLCREIEPNDMHLSSSFHARETVTCCSGELFAEQTDRRVGAASGFL